MRSADLNSWICVGDKTYLLCVRQCAIDHALDLPSWRVALQVLALPLQHTSPNLNSSWVMLARVFNILQPAERHVGVHKMSIVSHKSTPLMIPGHRYGARAQPLNSVVHLVGIALQDCRKRVVCFLDFSNDNGFKLPARVFKIQISLRGLVILSAVLADCLTLCR